METECIKAINNDSPNKGLNLEVLQAVSESCTHAVSVAPISGLFKMVNHKIAPFPIVAIWIVQFNLRIPGIKLAGMSFSFYLIMLLTQNNFIF